MSNYRTWVPEFSAAEKRDAVLNEDANIGPGVPTPADVARVKGVKPDQVYVRDEGYRPTDQETARLRAELDKRFARRPRAS